jgi:hypothetical protein
VYIVEGGNVFSHVAHFAVGHVRFGQNDNVNNAALHECCVVWEAAAADVSAAAWQVRVDLAVWVDGENAEASRCKRLQHVGVTLPLEAAVHFGGSQVFAPTLCSLPFRHVDGCDEYSIDTVRLVLGVTTHTGIVEQLRSG